MEESFNDLEPPLDEMHHKAMKRFLFSAILGVLLFLLSASAGYGYEYQLYKNQENFGIVVFPKKLNFGELDDYLHSIVFKPVESGKAVMRFGSKGENETFMMPQDVQKKHGIEKFVVIQILPNRSMLVGVYDPEWGLTLPSSTFTLEDIKKNIPKTLNIFRGSNPQKPVLWRGLRPHPEFTPRV